MTEMRFDMREPSFTLKIVYLAIFYIIIGSKIITKIFNKFKVTIPSSILKLARSILINDSNSDVPRKFDFLNLCWIFPKMTLTFPGFNFFQD